MKSNFLRILLISAVCFLSACSERSFESSQLQSPIRLEINENMGMLGAAWDNMANIEENPKIAKNLSKAITSMDFIPDDENFVSFIKSLKNIGASNQPADFKTGFREDLKGFHEFWNSNLRTLERKQRELQRFCDKHVTAEYLNKIRTLFNSKLPNQKTIVYLIPAFHEDHATSFYIGNDMIFLQLMPSNTVDHIGVVLHEFFHINYAAMDPSIRNEMSKIFQENGAEIIQNFMNEALAVAGGNVITKLQFENKKEEKGFDCEYINQFGIALAPIVKSYMDEGKSLDRSFFEQSIKIFKKEFPDYKSNIKYRMIDVCFFSSEQDEGKLKERTMLIMKFLNSNKIWCANIQSYDLKDGANRANATNIVFLKDNENFGNLKVRKNEMIVQHAKTSVLRIIIKTEDLNILEQAITRLLKMDTSSDFRMVIKNN